MIWLVTFAVAWQAGAGLTRAQNSSLYQRVGPNGNNYPATMGQINPIQSVPVPPREIRLHDIISIRVEELARMQADGEVERRKNASYDARLLDWLTLNGLGSSTQNPQTGGDPRIRGTLTQLYRAQTDLETTERLTFNIAAQVVDIRPNGNIILEAHKEVRNNNESWRASLTGIVRQQDIGPDNVVLSRNVVDLRIDKHEAGHVRDGYRRGWLTRFMDSVNPF